MRLNNVFDQDFCLFLNYLIENLLVKRNNDAMDAKDTIETKDFWCDGVKFETETDSHACFTIHTGKSGQIEYNVFLHLGDISSEIYANAARIQSDIYEVIKLNVPDVVKQVHFFSVDVPRKRIYLELL